MRVSKISAAHVHALGRVLCCSQIMWQTESQSDQAPHQPSNREAAWWACPNQASPLKEGLEVLQCPAGLEKASCPWGRAVGDGSSQELSSPQVTASKNRGPQSHNKELSSAKHQVGLEEDPKL